MKNKKIYTLILVSFINLIISIIVTNFLANIWYILLDVYYILKQYNESHDNSNLSLLSEIDFTILYDILNFNFLEYYIVFIVILSTLLIIVLKINHHFKTNYGTLIDGQKGTSQFATLDDIKTQYRRIPEKEELFEGIGGFVVAGDGNGGIFIDDSAVNNLGIGSTRSGKGERTVKQMLDNLSRSYKMEDKASMILNDPKGELLAGSKDILEQRGYFVTALNLVDLSESMHFNILKETLDYYLEGDYDSAQQSIKSVATALYFDDKVQDKFWQNSAISVFSAIGLYLIDKAVKEGRPDKVTMYTLSHTINYLGATKVSPSTGEKIHPMSQEEPVSLLEYEMMQLPSNHPARMLYATAQFAEGNTLASILASTTEKLAIFSSEPVGKMTAKSSFDPLTLGFGRYIQGFALPRQKVEIHFERLNKKHIVKANHMGKFSLFHKNKLELDDIVSFKLSYEDKVYITKLKVLRIHEDGKVDFTMIEAAEEISEKRIVAGETQITNRPAITIARITQMDKLIAVFLVTPDYDKSNHVLASIFVSQTYTALAKAASLVEGNTLYRLVHFILDEAGNMPPISNLPQAVTVCLGRGIRFTFLIQALSQFEELYGKTGARTIFGNCSNWIYYKTNDLETAKEISSILGEHTIESVTSRSHTETLSKRNKTESLDARSLLNPDELMKLKATDHILIRSAKTHDLKGNAIVAHPIYATKENKMAIKYGYTYLKDIDTRRSLMNIHIDNDYSNINLEELLLFNDHKNNINKIKDPLSPFKKSSNTFVSQDSEPSNDENESVINIIDDVHKQTKVIDTNENVIPDFPTQEQDDYFEFDFKDDNEEIDINQFFDLSNNDNNLQEEVIIEDTIDDINKEHNELILSDLSQDKINEILRGYKKLFDLDNESEVCNQLLFESVISIKQNIEKGLENKTLLKGLFSQARIERIDYAKRLISLLKKEISK